MHVDGTFVDIDIGTPHRVEKLFARKDAARRLDQLIQQAVFRRTAVDGPPGASTGGAIT